MEAAIFEINEARKVAGREADGFAVGDMCVCYVGEPAWDTGKYCLSGSPGRIADHLAGRAGLGVTHMQVKLRSREAEELVDQIRAFAADVAPLVAAA
jgi:hypothetical protein